MFERFKRARNQDGTFKKDVWWTPWSDSWEYKLSEDLKDMLERTAWTFIEAFIGALTVAPLVGVEAETIQLAALGWWWCFALAESSRHMLKNKLQSN